MDLPPKTCDLSAALKRMGGDLPLLEQVVKFVREDAPGFVARLQSAIGKGDVAELHAAAHALKGLVVNVDAEASSQLAFRLELSARAGNLTEAAILMRQLEREIARLLDELVAKSS